MKTVTLKILSRLATVLVALLLYGVLVILQMPRHARAATDASLAVPHAASMADSRVSTIRTD